MARNTEIFYLTLEDVKALHSEILVLTGDTPQHLRDANTLASAVMKPQWISHYGTADLVEQAAQFCIVISQAQAFTNGNKRTALYATDVFLRQNGLAFPRDIFDIIKWLGLIAGRTELDKREKVAKAFTAWMRRVLIRIDAQPHITQQKHRSKISYRRKQVF